MPEPPFVFVYLRKSRDRAEIADPDLLSKHRRELIRLAESYGDQPSPDQIFEEVGSGERIHRRPVFASVLEAIERLPRGAGGRLYTTEVSRATRGNLTDQGRVEDALMRASVIHVTRGGQFDLNRANDRLNWRIQASLASHELGVYKERVEAARLDMAREGRLRTGKPPLGWAWDKNLEQPVPNHLFPVVQAICRDALSLSTYELSEKYALPQATILNLLRNPFIAGWPAKRWFPHNGERQWVGPSHLLKPDQWIWPTQQAEYPAACTLAEWQEIQKALDRRRDLREKRFSDKGWCRDVVRFVGYEGLQPRLGVWKCPKTRILTYELAPKGVPRLYIDREAVHSAAEAVIIPLLANSPALHSAALRLEEEAQAPIASVDMDRQIRALEQDLDDLLLLEAKAERNRDAERVVGLNRKQQAIQKELKALRSQARAAQAPNANSAGLLEDLSRLAGGAARAWQSATDTERRQIAQALLESILVAVEACPRGIGVRYRRDVVAVNVHPYLLVA